MRLSDYFAPADVRRDGAFQHADEVETAHAHALVFCLTSAALRTALDNPCVSSVLTTPLLADGVREHGLAIVDDPRLEFFKLYNVLRDGGAMPPPFDAFGIGPGCDIHPSATIASKVQIGSRVVIGAGAIIEEYSAIGDDSYVAGGVVIGAEGLLTVNDGPRRLRVPHAGSVAIGCNATILSGSVVARSLYRAPTRIGNDTQIAILTNIGHGASVGARCVVSGNCVIAGAVVVEDDVWIGASCSIAQGLRIGRKARLNIGSIIIDDVAAEESVSGNFAIPHAVRIRNHLLSRA